MSRMGHKSACRPISDDPYQIGFARCGHASGELREQRRRLMRALLDEAAAANFPRSSAFIFARQAWRQAMDEDRVRGTAREARGVIKEAAGRAAGDDRLAAEGLVDQAAGAVQRGY